MPVQMPALVADLAGESADLFALLDTVGDGWDRPTPAEGWDVRDQAGHLAWFDDAAVTALTAPERFRAARDALFAEGALDFPDRLVAEHHAQPGPDIYAWLRRSREQLLTRFGQAEPTLRLPWYGPDMSAASSVTARLMETWAHGQDIADALGVRRTPTARLRHIADLGVRTRGFAFALRGRPTPAVAVHVELTGPDGEHWAWGEPGIPDRVSGPAEDFCLVVAQRRHLADTDLEVTGEHAAEWMSIAQVFAGAPGPGRPPAG